MPLGVEKMIKLFACDLDGTLIRWFDEENGLFTNEDINAIQNLQKSPMHFLVNTSRQIHFLDHLMIPELMHLDTIAGAGSTIRLNDEIVVHHVFEKDEIQQLISYFKDIDYCQLLAVTNKKNMISTNHNNSRYQRLQNDEIDREFGHLSPINLQDYSFAEDEVINFFYVNTDLDDNLEFYHQLRDDLGQFEIIRCSSEAMQITKLHVNKKNALLQVMEQLQLNSDEVAVIGDSYNDLFLFEEFEHSFVMSHASEEIKKYAKYQVDSVAAAIQIAKELK